MPLSLPIYFLGRTFVLHTRINGRQFKRSLKTADPRVAKLRAIQLLGAAHMSVFPRFSKPSHSLSDQEWRRFELDVKNGVFKTDGSDKDYERMMQAYERWKADREVEAIGLIAGGFPASGQPSQAPGANASASSVPDPKYVGAGSEFECRAKGPTYSVVYEEYKTLNPGASKGTLRDYKDTVDEFEKFAGKPTISQICDRHITDYMKWLTKTQGNSESTVDKKIGALRALFNFGKEQKMVTGENFAAGRNLLSRKEKNANGHKFYELDEIKEVMGCPQFHQLAQSEPGFYFITVAALLTGIRISALAALTAKDFRKTVAGNPYIEVSKDKTNAGTRNVPVPLVLWQALKDYLSEHASFGFQAREDGGGASDPVRKILNAHLESIGASGRGFTMHGLRKTLNQAFIDDEVHFENRCQFLGHDIDHVNVAVYGKGKALEKISLDKLAERTAPTLLRLMKVIGFPQGQAGEKLPEVTKA